VPALFQIFLEYGMPKTILDNFNTVMLSGDKITLPLAKLAQKSMQNANIFTLGGATEAAIWSIHYLLNDLNKDFKHVPYGIPLSNQSIHILDENLQPCPDYAVGKLYIGGVGLAKGYFNDNEKSQRHFIQNPHTNEYLYDTGDLGAFNPSLGGFIEFHGREDHQVKVGGFRIELGEIENSLNAHKHISKSLVRLINDASGQQSRQMLVAYIVSDETINENQLKAYLSDDLPEYMIPRFFIEMDEIPLSANGKVDDKALPKVDIEQKYHANYVSPKNDLEVSIQSIVSTHLGIQKASVEESLFDLGATSLDVVSIHQQLEKQLSLSLSILDLFDKPTIRAFSEHIASKDEKSNILDQARQKARSNTRRERLQRRKNQVGVESEV
jgi:acyl-coenzyme A synthetase/AMP-(fatty) acid ligase/acyl carrier protein